MKEVNLDKLKAQIPERDFDRAYSEAPHFKIAFSDAGYTRALWNFMLALMEAEADDFAIAYEIAETSHDLKHLCGFHTLRWQHTRWHELRWFLTLVWHHPSILNLRPHLKEYIEFICENSKVQWGRYKRPMGLLEYALVDSDDLNPRLPWRTTEWVAARRPIRIRPEPLSEFWPYLTTRPTEEHDLLLMVDRAVPKTFSAQERGDLCQDLIVEILSGNVSAANLQAEIPNLLRMFWRTMPSKYRHVSLDTPIYDSGRSISLVDTLVAPEPVSEDDDLKLYRLTSATITAPPRESPSTQDLATLLSDSWEANRLLHQKRPDNHGGFARADKGRDNTERNRGYSPSSRSARGAKRLAPLVPLLKGRQAWTLETAAPDELRDEEVA